ncbi:MAG: hypothetical protein ACETWM_06650 [Candidatus Lokiarchaeia archaeon]
MSEYNDEDGRPRVWAGRFNRCWLLGMFVQHSLLAKEGVNIPSPIEIMMSKPDIDIVEAINLQRQIYGAEVDWENQTIIVRYKSKRYNVTKQIIEIVNQFTYGNRVDELSIDTKGFDFKSAASCAQENIISKIVSGELPPE